MGRPSATKKQTTTTSATVDETIVAENSQNVVVDNAEIEENETLSKYYKNYSKEGYIDKDKNMFPKREGMIYENMEHINYKVWDRDAYLKMNMVLIKSLQNKIEELEKRIKEMEGNK